jgi:hypothetical protein
MDAKTQKELQEEIENYIEARRWCRRRIAEGTATDEDAAKVAKCRELAVLARAAGGVSSSIDDSF